MERVAFRLKVRKEMMEEYARRHSEVWPEMLEALPRQALHAATLGFEHPVTGEMLEFTSPLPPDMTHLIAQLRAA